MICVFIIWREHPKAHRKWFYVVLWFYGEAGNRTCDPWFTRHSAYPLHHGGFSRQYYLPCGQVRLSLQPWLKIIYRLVIKINGFKKHEKCRHNHSWNKLMQYMGVTRCCVSFSYQDQLKLFFTKLTEGVVSHTGKTLGTVDQSKLLIIYHITENHDTRIAF